MHSSRGDTCLRAFDLTGRRRRLRDEPRLLSWIEVVTFAGNVLELDTSSRLSPPDEHTLDFDVVHLASSRLA